MSAGQDATYSFAAVAKILELPENKLRYWSQIGFVGPSLRKGAKQLFSFQDLVSVKAAKELVDRGVRVADIRKALEKVRATLPEVDRPLDRVRVAFDGAALVVVDDGSAYEVTGQKVFDFRLSDLADQATTHASGPATTTRLPTMGSAAAVLAANGQVFEHAAEREDEGHVAARPATAFSWFMQGLSEQDGGRWDDAETSFREALSLDPGLSAAHTNLGQIAFARGDRNAARAEFEKALALDPEQAEARFNLANLILETGDVELAAAELRRVLQSEPDFADAHFNLAVALERLGGRAQAKAHLERFLSLAGADGGHPRAADAAIAVASARALVDRLAE